MIYIATQFHNI